MMSFLKHVKLYSVLLLISGSLLFATGCRDFGVKETAEKLSCTISIECHSVLANKNLVKNPGILACAGNGTILPATEVEFTAGETVFDVLKRVCTTKHIPLSFQFTPLYGSYYIQAINGLEEFDVGELSGWMYQVNGRHPNFGCSSYTLEDGDIIEWQYTCDLGYDVGGGYDGE